MGKINCQVLVGSDSDLPVMQECAAVLDELGVSFRVNVASAHRTPEKVRIITAEAVKDGAEVFITAAGMAAALPGVVASETLLPVIGIPLQAKVLDGLDAAFSVLQMPPGIPVATVAIGKAGAVNAGILAAQILSIKYPEIKNKLMSYRKKLASSVEEKDLKLQKLGLKAYIEEKKS